jgi:hypothetical protein
MRNIEIKFINAINNYLIWKDLFQRVREREKQKESK